MKRKRDISRFRPGRRIATRTRRASPAAKRVRRGLSMGEIVAATALLSVATLMVVPVVSGVADVREEASQHHLAVLEAGNLMERIAVIRATEPLTQGRLDRLELSAIVQERLDEPQLEITLGEPEGGPPARRLSVSISWRNRAGERAAPVQVVTFIHDQEETP